MILIMIIIIYFQKVKILFFSSFLTLKMIIK